MREAAHTSLTKLPTTRVCGRDLGRLKTLVMQNGVTVPDTLRHVIAAFVATNSLLLPTGTASKDARLPELAMPQALFDGLTHRAAALGLTRADVIRRLIEGVVRAHH